MWGEAIQGGRPRRHSAQQPPSIHYNKSGLRAAFAVHKRQSTWTKTHHNFNSISTFLASSQSLDSRESKKDILYSSSLHIYLDERDNRPDDLQELRPNGFTEETVISDFPVRDRKAVLHVRRRRWLTPEGKNVVLNVYPLAATGTRYCAEFAAFLKDSLGYDAGDGTLPW